MITGSDDMYRLRGAATASGLLCTTGGSGLLEAWCRGPFLAQSVKTGGRFSERARTASSKLRVVMRTSSWAFISARMWVA